MDESDENLRPAPRSGRQEPETESEIGEAEHVPALDQEGGGDALLLPNESPVSGSLRIPVGDILINPIVRTSKDGVKVFTRVFGGGGALLAQIIGKMSSAEAREAGVTEADRQEFNDMVAALQNAGRASTSILQFADGGRSSLDQVARQLDTEPENLRDAFTASGAEGDP